MAQYKKIWVTGGTGLLGQSLKSVVNEFPGRDFVFSGSKDCELTNLSSVTSFIEKHNFDAIVHMAAVAGGIGLSMKHPATLLRDNVLMNMYVLEGARLCKVKKTIMSLSTGMYAVNAPNPIKEEYIHDGYPHESNYSYSFAKRLVDPSIKAYRTEYGMNVIGLIPNGMFGEYSDYREDRSVMLAALIRRFYENRNGNAKITIWGDGSPLREYTYGPDMARAYMWCLENYDEAQILHPGSTEEHSVKETAFMIAEIMGINKDRLEFDTSKPAGIHKKSTDNSKFVSRSQFKYTPFRIGLERTIHWFMEHYNDPTKVKLFAGKT
jgi:GDP-L-fucose synthase